MTFVMRQVSTFTIATGGAAAYVDNPTGGAYGAFSFQNQSDGDQYINFGAPAGPGLGGFKIPAGALFDNPPNQVFRGQLSVYGTTTNDNFSVFVADVTPVV